VKLGMVIAQDPQPGEKMTKGNFVTIEVSQGPPKAPVPDLVGRSRDEAVAALSDVGLKANVVPVNSLKPVDTVLATSPKAGTELIEGSTVRVNVSKGPKPIAVPNVIGSAFESAQSTLQGLNFAVARVDVDDSAAEGTVVGQSPAAGSLQGKGSVITLQVSKGPTTSQVPDVSSLAEADAQAQLETSGFQVEVQEEIVDDESLDGLVLRQDPSGGAEAEPGTTVVIVVGRFEAPAEPTTTTTITTP
jgi:serine/threonine-protein kinase